MGGRLLAVTSATSHPKDGPLACADGYAIPMRRLELRIPLPTACAGTLGIWLAAQGRGWVALLVLAIGLLAEIAAAAATAVHGAAEGLRDGLRQRFQRRASGTDDEDR